MAFQFSCPGCKVTLALPANTPGAVVTCPRCGTSMQLPGAVQPVVVPPVSTPGPPPIDVKTDDLTDYLHSGFLRGPKKRSSGYGEIAGLLIAAVIMGLVLAIGIGIVHFNEHSGLDTIRGGVWAVILLALLGIGLLLYIMPTIIAFYRQHQNLAAIAVLNILTGWSFLGWVAALVWAFTEVRSRQHTHYHYKS